MTNKKITIKEFNKHYFENFRDINKVVPIFEEWSDEDGENKESHIKEIEIWFKNGDKIAFVPYSNKDNTLDDEDNPICCAIQILEYKGEPVNWKIEK